jgi:hypothetical protein
LLVKINLKTACGCTRHFFETWHGRSIPLEFRVPIKATSFVPPPMFGGTRLVVGFRGFKIVDAKKLSRSRMELWCEETLSG